MTNERRPTVRYLQTTNVSNALKYASLATMNVSPKKMDASNGRHACILSTVWFTSARVLADEEEM